MLVYKKLGFSDLETAEIVMSLNKLLANYQIHYQKLRAFHWNVEGADFFELHQEFEKEYEAVKENIDKLAERIRVFGQKPFSTLAQYLKFAEIKEASEDLTATQMVVEILDDFETLLSFMIEALDAAKSVGDSSTMHMIMGFVERMEKRHWMFSSSQKRAQVAIPADL